MGPTISFEDDADFRMLQQKIIQEVIEAENKYKEGILKEKFREKIGRDFHFDKDVKMLRRIISEHNETYVFLDGEKCINIVTFVKENTIIQSLDLSRIEKFEVKNLIHYY